VVWFNAKGKSKPLAGATVSVTGHTGKTNSHGIVPLTPSHTGAFSIAATDKGYVRSAVTVNVTG
jgi:hypothetical protein